LGSTLLDPPRHHRSDGGWRSPRKICLSDATKIDTPCPCRFLKLNSQKRDAGQSSMADRVLDARAQFTGNYEKRKKMLHMSFRTMSNRSRLNVNKWRNPRN